MGADNKDTGSGIGKPLDFIQRVAFNKAIKSKFAGGMVGRAHCAIKASEIVNDFCNSNNPLALKDIVSVLDYNLKGEVKVSLGTKQKILNEDDKSLIRKFFLQEFNFAFEGKCEDRRTKNEGINR